MHGVQSPGATVTFFQLERVESKRKVHYLRFHVLKTRGANEREANQEDVCLRIRKRAKTIVILLSSSIPKTKRDRLAIDLNIGRVVVEHWPLMFQKEHVLNACWSGLPVGMYSPWLTRQYGWNVQHDETYRECVCGV